MCKRFFNGSLTITFYVKTDKSAFHVSFLGFVLTPGRVSMDENKVIAVSNGPKLLPSLPLPAKRPGPFNGLIQP